VTYGLKNEVTIPDSGSKEFAIKTIYFICMNYLQIFVHKFPKIKQ